MKHFLPIIALLIVQSCGLCHHLPPETNVSVRDSVRIEIRDSINWIPKERIVDVVPVYDSLKLETSLAKAIAYVDTTTHTLKGKLENKEGVKTKYVYKDRIQYRDSIQIKEVPYPVEKPVKYVPKIYKWSMGFSIFVILLIAVWIYFKIRHKPI